MDILCHGKKEDVCSIHKTQFLEKVQQSSEAIQNGNFDKAIRLYTEAISLDPINHILYSNRSAAFIKICQFQKALKDAVKARQLNPKWSKAYFREGIALQCLGRHGDSLAAFAAGLAQDPKNTQLLSGMVEAAVKSPLKARLEPLYQQLQKMKLDKSPFVIIAVIGQELLSAGAFAQSVKLLESALRIGTCSMKLRGSVFSALSSSHWGMGNMDKAIACMQQDLGIAKSLGDQEGECRVHGNLGSAFFSKGNYKEALSNHRQQLVLAMRLKERQTAVSALSSLGHVYTAIGDYPNALASHKQCVLLVRQMKHKLQEARETGNVGAVYLAMGDFDRAVECHNEHMKIAKQLKDSAEEARAYSNLGSAYHYKRNFETAIEFHKKVLNVAEELSDKTLEARAYAGLGHASRCIGDMNMAKKFHEKQLDNALQTKDKVAEGRACSNLGIIYQNLSEHEAALKLHKAHLNIAKNLQDRASQGRSYGNIGNAYSSLKQYELAIRYHKQELAISKEVNDRHSEASTFCNLAVAYQALNMHEQAVQNYRLYLNISRELKDTPSEARALCNLGNYHGSRGEFSQAVPFYEQYLILSQELHDVEGEGKACHMLGYAHYSLGNHKEAIRYYEQDLSLAKDVHDRNSMARAYCNLGLAHKALSDYPQALECQKYFLTTVHSLKNLNGKFRALGNLGDVFMKMNSMAEAVKMFNQQLVLAKQLRERNLEATSYANLGLVNKTMAHFDKALGFHTQELTIRQEMNDVKGECRAHGHLGNVHMALGNYSNAYRCYEEQLERSRDLRDSAIEAQACGNLGITKMNMKLFDDAIGLFEQQLAMLEQVLGNNATLDKGRAFGNLGDCYESLRDYEEAVKCYEQFLAIAHNANNLVHQEKAYRGLGKAHRAMGNLQQALVCFEKRLVVTHELDDLAAKSSAYGELGCLHTQLGNFEQAIRCLKNQIQIARDMGDDLGESDAACGLGGVYQQMGDYETALQYHEMDLKLAEKLGSAASQCRAFGNLGLSEESLGNYEKAIRYQEQHLTIAAQMNNRPAKILAYSSLGRVHHAIGNYMQAVQYLQQGLQIAEQLSRKEDEAKIRHRLGLALWGHGDLEEAQYQLYKAAELFENIRREAQINSDYKLSLFDLQTASYQALQRVLVSLGRHEEALVVAERGRTRAFVDLLLERQTGSESFHGNIDNSCVTIEQIQDVIDRQKASVLYYSVAAGYLYSWLIMPHKGIIKFHESSIAEVEAGSDPEDSQSMIFSPTSLLDQYVGHLRESLGLETHTSNLSTSRLSLSRISGMVSETESEADDLWQQHLEEVGDRLNLEQDRSGFLRMVNRNHIMNSSSYSLSSLFSFSGGSVANSIASGTLTRKSSKKLGKAPLGALYELLIGPLEDSLPSSKNSQSVTNDLILVLQGDLYLVPFSVLRSGQTSPCLYERFNLIMVPSIRALQTNIMHNKTSQFNPESTGSLIIGNPKLSSIVTDQWQWTDLPSADAEVKMLAEMLGTKPVTGCFAVKETVMQEMQQVEVVHFATHISWKLSAIVLSSGEMAAGSRTTKTLHGNLEHMEFSDNSSSLSSAFDGPSLSEFLLTAADVLNIKLSAKLVVLSSGHTDDRAGRVNSDGVVGLTRAFLAAGAQCVLFSLWPVAEMASRILLKAFYTGLLQGHRASHALNNAMRTVQNTRQFCHPSNWAGWVLLGSDIKLTSKVALMGHALRELLQTPTKSREAMRVVLHLVEKSLQRIRRGQRNAMYTTEQSVENKVGPVAGWRDLLMSVGFRFEQASNSGSLPAAVFFPTSDPGDRLTQCSASLQALIGLSLDTLLALSKLLANPEAGEALSSLMGEVNTKLLHSKDGDILLPLSVRLWRVPGCHEFLASLGFDLMDVGKDEVTLRAGKQASRRILQFSHQALVALFDTQEAPRMLLLDSSSSMESLTSSGSATSTSNFSKGSSPMGSPKGKRRSIFNPAEVEKLPSASRKKLQDGTLSMTVTATSGKKHYNPNISLQLAHQTDIRTKYSSGSDSANQDDYSQDEATATVVSIETHEAPSQGDCNDIEFSYQKKRYFPKSKPLNTYSTSSTSEGEEVAQTHESDHEDLQRQSRFRSSAASGSSTLTLRSVGSGGLRRNRVRSSAVSIRSSASDRTLKGSNESLSMIGSYEDKGKKVKEPPPPPPVRTVSQVANQPDSDSSLTSLTSTDINASDSSVKNMALDPSTIAQKVLAETHIQREALEKMQRLSLRGHLNLRRIHQKESNSSVNVPSNKTDDLGDSSVSLSKPPVAFSSIYSTPRSVHDDIIETQLEKMNNEPAPVIPISPVTMSSSETGDGALSESLTPTISSFLNSPSTELSTDSSHSAFVVCTEKSLSPASHSNSCHDETGFHGESDCRTSAATFQDSGLSSMPTTNCSSSSAGNSSFDSTSSCHVTTVSGKERPPVPAKPKILNNKVSMHKHGEEAPQSGSTFSAFHHRPVPVTHTGQHVRFSDQCVTYSSNNNYPPSVSRSYDSNPVPSDSLSMHTAGASSVRLTRQVVSANRQPSPRASYNNCPPNVESVITSKRFSSSSEDSHWSSELSSLNDSGGGKAQSPSFEMRSFQPYNSKYQQYSTQQLLRKNANMGSHGYGFHSTPQQQRQTMHGANDRELLQGEEHSPHRTKPFHEFPERTTSFCESPDRTKPFCESPERIKPFADLQDGKVTSGQSVLVARIAPSRTNVSTSESSQTKVPVSQVVYRDGERRVIPKNSVLQSSKC